MSNANELVLARDPANAGSEALTAEEKAQLDEAIRVLTRPGKVLGRLADLTGGLPARLGARGMRMIPGLEPAITAVAEAALARAFDIAVLGLPSTSSVRERGRLSAAFVGLSGAISGFTGFIGFVPDAFFTTLAIMRNVAQIAVEEGEDLSEPDTKLACLAVFGSSPSDPGASGEQPDISYFLTRSALHGRPLAMLVSGIARRYGVSLSQKFALQAVPLIGAAGGAGLNVAYMAHYRRVARAVFVVRRLRRKNDPITNPAF